MITKLAIRHFLDRKKPCLMLEQGNQGIVIATIRNAESEALLNRFLDGGVLCRDMPDIFKESEGKE